MTDHKAMISEIEMQSFIKQMEISEGCASILKSNPERITSHEMMINMLEAHSKEYGEDWVKEHYGWYNG